VTRRAVNTYDRYLRRCRIWYWAATVTGVAMAVALAVELIMTHAAFRVAPWVWVPWFCWWRNARCWSDYWHALVRDIYEDHINDLDAMVAKMIEKTKQGTVH
jgi:hypothetical protein